MFRKPKKGSLSKFRQTKKRSHDDDDNYSNKEDYNAQNDYQKDTAGGSDGITPSSSNSMIAKKKKFRRRSSSSSSSDEENAIHDTSTNTSELLQQIKKETQKKKKINFDKGKNSNNDKNDDNNHHRIFMNEYKSKNVLTQKELATLQAQHHPSADGATMTNTDDINNGNERQQPKITIEKEARNKFLAGPIKASKFIRTTSRFDYQPDICKDYKETGFCGYGDTCIYLHDRSNMKSGFALEQEWEEKKRKEKEEKEKQMDLFCKEVSDGVDGGSNDHRGGDDVGVVDDGLPFACHLCRDAFQEPVVTICNHYFCQSCILKRVQENIDPSCPICNQDTNGVFNFPTKLVNKRKKLVGRNGSWEQFANFLKK